MLPRPSSLSLRARSGQDRRALHFASWAQSPLVTRHPITLFGFHSGRTALSQRGSCVLYGSSLNLTLKGFWVCLYCLFRQRTVIQVDILTVRMSVSRTQWVGLPFVILVMISATLLVKEAMRQGCGKASLFPIVVFDK